MNRRILLLCALALSCPKPPLWSSEAGASWLRTRTSPNALNPRISAIGDFVGVSGPTRDATRLSLRELELGIQSEVDPYARADIFIAKPDGEAVEIEEGYVTLHSLPGRLQLRGGKLKPSFGKLNLVHHHEFPQVDAPIAVEGFLGGEGLNSVGAEASRVFAPLGLFTELSYAFLQDLGPAEEKEPATTTVTDTGGNKVKVRIHQEEPKPSRRLRDFAHVARARVYHDLTDAANVEAGLSGAIHQPREQEHRKLAALDLTVRWKPLQEGLYRSFIWRSEALLSRRELPDEFDAASGAIANTAASAHRRGLYSYGEYQCDRRWRLGLRGDYSEDPAARGRRAVTRAVSPYAVFTLSEFNRLRLEYQFRRRSAGTGENRLFLQWTIVLGPHGGHPF